MNTPARIAVLALLSLTLAACQGEAKKPDAGQQTAKGEILEGSISDAMLPVDTVRSQPPLAPKSSESDSSSDKPDKPDKPDKAGKSPSGDAASTKPAAEDPAP
jgi:hypothetical protein